jgi:hypothetical protein
MGEPTLGRPIVPKEHGAWAVLYGAFLAGVGVAGRVTVPVMLLLAGVTLLALVNGALVLTLRSARSRLAAEEPRRVWAWLVMYAAGALMCLAPLVIWYHMVFLFAFALAAACLVALRAFFVWEGDERSLLGELIGTVGLTLVGPTAHAVAMQDAQPMGAVLWLLLSLFFASGVFYVRMRIRVMIAQRTDATSVARRARWSCLVYHLLLLVVIPALAVGNLIPWAALLAYAPALWRATAGLRRRDAILNVRRLGWSEVGVTAAFVLILVVTL